MLNKQVGRVMRWVIELWVMDGGGRIGNWEIVCGEMVVCGYVWGKGFCLEAW